MLIDHNSASPEAQTISQWCTVSVAEAIKSGYATKVGGTHHLLSREFTFIDTSKTTNCVCS